SQNAAINIPEQTKAMVGAAADLQAQLIAAQSMLRGLQQIYTNNNIRVREMQAQVDELQRQLAKLGGKGVKLDEGASLPSGELYPSIRQLPLLGARYLDLYRTNRIDEALYELLKKQDELAKLEEARDVPVVQVLDHATVPLKKTSPHRLWIMLFGMTSCFLVGAGWIVGGAYWERTDAENPWKMLTQEVVATLRVRLLNIAPVRWGRATYARRHECAALTRPEAESCDAGEKSPG
ncbi:MAG TPA: GNVR domain-containing protein, partial [Nitrospira sp.]|nr:GNVR domain-containing protein [Nitrospira sp.]